MDFQHKAGEAFRTVAGFFKAGRNNDGAENAFKIEASPDKQIEAVLGGPDSIRAFAAAGGTFNNKFSDTLPKGDEYGGWGRSSALAAAEQGADTIRAYHAAGGKFGNEIGRYGDIVVSALVSGRTAPAAYDIRAVQSLEALLDCGKEFSAKDHGDAVRTVLAENPGAYTNTVAAKFSRLPGWSSFFETKSRPTGLTPV